jgi:alkylation response protein AidB-like acyl-CoA dehydrogenase
MRSAARSVNAADHWPRYTPADPSAGVLIGLIDRTGLDPALIGDQSSNIARFASRAAGWPVAIPGTTVNRARGSSQQAVDFAGYITELPIARLYADARVSRIYGGTGEGMKSIIAKSLGLR